MAGETTTATNRKRRKLSASLNDIDIDEDMDIDSQTLSARNDDDANDNNNGSADAVLSPSKTEVKERTGLYHCDYCGNDLTKKMRIKCAICQDFDLCLDCFSVGVELNSKGHKNTHAYRVMDDMSAPLFSEGWGADEELLLLEGIEMFGLGNWQGVAEHVGTKSKTKCAAHYWSLYIEVPTFPLPDLHAPVKKEKEVLAHEPEAAASMKDIRLLKDDDDEEGPGQQQAGSKAQKTAASAKGGEPAAQVGAEIGFIPFRGDFEIEYDNSAEELLAEMAITETDTPEDREMKLKILEIYHMKLEERNRRKQFAIERNLVDFKKYQAIQRRRPPEDRMLVNKYRPFARFVSKEENDEFIEGLLAAQNIRRKIETLKMYRRNGIKTLAEGEKFEAEKKKREAELDVRRERERHAYLYSGRSTVRSARKLQEDRAFMAEAYKSLQPATKKKQQQQQQQQQPPDVPLDVASAPNAELLSAKEREICSLLRLPPKQYMLFKDGMVRETARLGYLKRVTARNMFTKADPIKINKLYDFFVESGWVIPPPEHGSNGNNTATQPQPQPQSQPVAAGGSNGSNNNSSNNDA